MKSHVSVEQKVCPVCGKASNVGILLDRRLEDSLETNTVTGFDFCKEHQKFVDDGYVICIEAVGKRDTPDRIKEDEISNVERTGRAIYLPIDLANDIFDVKVKGMAFIEVEAFTMICDKIEKALAEKED